MNPKHIKYILTVLEEGSITKAAKKLYISQPSLSQMIKLIETNLGAAIFNRNADPIALTFAGEKYLQAARQVLTINENLTREIHEILDEEYGKFRLGIPVQRGMQVLPYILPKFRARYPHVELSILEQGSAATEKLLMEGKLDIACMTTYPKYDELNYILIEEEEMVLLASKQAPIAKRLPSGAPIDIRDAKEETFISSKEGHSARAIQERLFTAAGITPQILLETSSIEVGKRTAIACGAVMICPLNYIEMTPELMPFCNTYPLKGIENHRHFYLCHRNDLYLTKYMKEFVRMMTEQELPAIPKSGTMPES